MKFAYYQFCPCISIAEQELCPSYLFSKIYEALFSSQDRILALKALIREFSHEFLKLIYESYI